MGIGRRAAELDLADVIRVIRMVVDLARPIECACLGSGISLPQYRLLAALDRQGGRAGEIAARIGVNRSTLSALASSVEKIGLVARDDVAADLRGVRLELTADGERALEAADLRMGEALLAQACEAGSERIAELRRLFVRAFLRLAAESSAHGAWRDGNAPADPAPR